MDLRDVQRRFESHGWRPLRVPLRLGLRFVKASEQSARPYVSDPFSHTLAFDCNDGLNW